MLQRLTRNRAIQQNISKEIQRRYGDGPPPKLLRKYEQFQRDDGVPVYLKGGFMDRILFGATLVGISIGLADGLYTLFKMAQPKKK